MIAAAAGAPQGTVLESAARMTATPRLQEPLERLYREFDAVTGADKLDAAVHALSATPSDPDYSTPWPEGTFTGASYNGDVISIGLADSSLHDRPSGMSEEDAIDDIEKTTDEERAVAPLSELSAQPPVEPRQDGTERQEGEQARLPEHRVQFVPLVSRHGA